MNATAADADILVIGTGAAGLSAAIALADAGFTVAAVGSLEQFGNGRTVALFEASLRFYDALKIWPRLADCAARIETIRMVDATHARMPIPPIEFAAREIGLAAFGENIENDDLVQRLATIAAEKPTLSIANERLVDLVDDSDAIEARLSIGQKDQSQAHRRRRRPALDRTRQSEDRRAPLDLSADGDDRLDSRMRSRTTASRSNSIPAAAPARSCLCRQAPARRTGRASSG